jgi:hypothetical protein
MSSADLTHWVQHPMAITPAAPASYEGADVYSGAMVEDPSDGSVKAFFACACGAATKPTMCLEITGPLFGSLDGMPIFYVRVVQKTPNAS